MKNKILKTSLIFFLLTSVSCCKTQRLLLGDNYVLSYVKETQDIDDSFVINKMTFQKLYELLEKDAISISSNISISKNIKKASEIIVSCGIYDLISLFDFSNKIIKYDEKRIQQKMELLDYYVYNSFQIINENSKKNKVYVLQLFNPLIGKFNNIDEFEIVINNLNELLNMYSNEFKFSYIELPNISNYVYDDFKLSKEANFYIEKQIYGKL